MKSQSEVSIIKVTHKIFFFGPAMPANAEGPTLHLKISNFTKKNGSVREIYPLGGDSNPTSLATDAS